MLGSNKSSTNTATNGKVSDWETESRDEPARETHQYSRTPVPLRKLTQTPVDKVSTLLDHYEKLN